MSKKNCQNLHAINEINIATVENSHNRDYETKQT